MARGLIGLFAVSLGVALVVASGAWLALPARLRAEWVPDSYRTTMPNAERYFYEVEGQVHLFGTDPIVNQSMRSADVLLVGNSRLMMGLDDEIIRGFFESRLLRPYFMGFARGLREPFCEEILRRRDLHPRWIIANADGFFRENSEGAERELLHATRVRAIQESFELNATLQILSRLHSWFPRFPVIREVACWRSRTTGAWSLRWPEPDGQPFPISAYAGTPADRLDPEIARAARHFKQLCDDLGARLILTYVPTPGCFDTHRSAELVAKELGVPLCAPMPEGLASFDRSHLTIECARVFTKTFVATLPEVVPEFANQSLRPAATGARP